MAETTEFFSVCDFMVRQNGELEILPNFWFVSFFLFELLFCMKQHHFPFVAVEMHLFLISENKTYIQYTIRLDLAKFPKEFRIRLWFFLALFMDRKQHDDTASTWYWIARWRRSEIATHNARKVERRCEICPYILSVLYSPCIGVLSVPVFGKIFRMSFKFQKFIEIMAHGLSWIRSRFWMF